MASYCMSLNQAVIDVPDEVWRELIRSVLPFKAESPNGSLFRTINFDITYKYETVCFFSSTTPHILPGHYEDILSFRNPTFQESYHEVSHSSKSLFSGLSEPPDHPQ